MQKYQIDWFAFSSEGAKNTWGILADRDTTDYIGAFKDWGNNYIHGDVPNIWRTLSFAEWRYLLYERKNANSLYAVAQVASTNGLIVLPDDWEDISTLPIRRGLHTETGNSYYAEYQSFTKEQWNVLEQRGAVFLPAAGGRDGISMTTINTCGWYWSSTVSDTPYRSGYVRFYSDSIALRERGWKFAGLSVRLVHDTIVHDYVDLGLSVKWATCNVGATTPEEYGDYFAWGETEPKTEYTWANYKWCVSTENNMTKYNASDGLTTLLPEDDAAHVHWGGQWRMPTWKEMKELCEYCTWIWETHNEINGYRIVGQNGNSLFLPAAGFQCIDGFKYKNRHGDYWSSSRAGNLNGALHPSFLQNNIYDSNSVRYYGFPIRPVLPKN